MRSLPGWLSPRRRCGRSHDDAAPAGVRSLAGSPPLSPEDSFVPPVASLGDSVDSDPVEVSSPGFFPFALRVAPERLSVL